MKKKITEMDESNPLFRQQKLLRMFCIDTPAIVRNMKNFYKCCGGLQQIEQTFKNPNKRLQFRFRPDDSNSIPLLSERKSCSDLVIKVKRKRQPDGSFGDYEFEPFGIVDTIFHFDNNICDMQLLPTSSNVCNEIMRSDFILNCDHEYSIENDNTNTLIRQYFYSRFPQPKPILPIMQKEEEKELANNLIRRIRKSRKVNALFVRWNDEKVPDKVPEAYLKNSVHNVIFDRELVDKLKQQFHERPVWSRHALLCHLKCQPIILRYILPQTAYFFENGPFRNLWVMYGYDPRKDPKSKIYQNIEIRAHINDLSLQSRKSSFFNDIKYTKPNDSSIQNLSNEERQESDIKSYRFGPEHPSSLDRTYYQLCDIELDEVQTIIHENDGQETEFTEKDGWLSNGAVERIRSIMNQTVMQMLEGLNVNGEREHSTIQYEDIEVSEVFENFDNLENHESNNIATDSLTGMDDCVS